MKIDTLEIATNARVLRSAKTSKEGQPRVEKIERINNVILDPDMPRPESVSKQTKKGRISVRA